MRKVVLLMHVSLDGFVAGPAGEMNWILFDKAIGDYTGSLTKDADTAVYGRITFQMMENYWPTAATQPGASAHDKQHAAWVNEALKVVFSKTLKKSDWNNTTFFDRDIAGTIAQMKNKPGKNLLVIGSVSVAHTLIQAGMIDEYRINVNPVVLGTGIPLFKNIHGRIGLKLTGERPFDCGVVALTYTREKMHPVDL